MTKEIKYIHVNGKRVNRKQAVKRWVKALRSGRYKQGQSTLRNPLPVGEPTTFQYCCLGVACAALRRTRWSRFDDLADYSRSFRKFLLGGSSKHESLLENKLIHMNDQDGSSFSTIAQYIEDTLL